MAQEWKTPRREPACRACERPFADGEAHFSSLAVHGGELVREDLCSACWRAGADAPRTATAGGSSPEGAAGDAAEPATDAAPAEARDHTAGVARGDVLVWWRTRHEAERKRKLALDVDLLERLFRSLGEREERNLRELRYLLCLLLMRKRRLKVVKVLRAGEEGAGTESFLCRRPRTQEEFRVAVFDFTPERADELRAELRRLLEGTDPDDVDQDDDAPGPSAAASGCDAEAGDPQAGDAESAPAGDSPTGPGAGRSAPGERRVSSGRS